MQHEAQRGAQHVQASTSTGMPAADSQRFSPDPAQQKQQQERSSDQTGAAAPSNGNGAASQVEQRQGSPDNPQHAGYSYGYDGAPGLPEQYWGPGINQWGYSAYPSQGGQPPGWDAYTGR